MRPTTRNQSTISQITSKKEAELCLRNLKRGWKKIAEFELKESEFVNANELKERNVKEIKIISEIMPVQTQHGIKATGKIEFIDGLETITKEMRFNQTFLNHIIKTVDSKDSKKWLNTVWNVKYVEIMGHLATVPA